MARGDGKMLCQFNIRNLRLHTDRAFGEKLGGPTLSELDSNVLSELPSVEAAFPSILMFISD